MARNQTIDHPQNGQSLPNSPLPKPGEEPGLHVELFGLLNSHRDIDKLRTELRHLLLQRTGAFVAAHVADPAGDVDELQMLGLHGAQTVMQRCQGSLRQVVRQALERKSLQLQAVEGEGGLLWICVPLLATKHCSDVLVMIVPNRRGLPHMAALIMETVVAYERIALRRGAVQEGEWQLDAMASLCELSTQVSQSTSLKEAAFVAANGIQRHLGARLVTIGWGARGRLKIVGTSGSGELVQSSDLHRDLRQAMVESQLRGEQTCWPPREGMPGHLLLAHQRLASMTNPRTIVSAPLVSTEGETVGAWVVIEPALPSPAPDECALIKAQNRTERFLLAAAPHIAAGLSTVRRATPGFSKRMAAAVVRGLWSRPGWCVALVVLALGLLMQVTAPYRIRCSCRTETVISRFASAPYDGILEQGFVEAGETVHRGTLLARMDGRELNWELAGVQADREQAARERDMQLADDSIPKAMQAELQERRLALKEQLLSHRRQNLEIVSPIHGIVLSGSLKQTSGKPVELGEVLYEIGPLTPLRVEIEVSAADIMEIQPGDTTDIWLEGAGREAMVGTVQRIRPRSEIRNGLNVFIAEVEVDNEARTLRPGMTGTARIAGRTRSLGWRLFHKPWEWMVTRLYW